MRYMILCFSILGVLACNSVYAAPVNVNKAAAQEIADSLNGIGLSKGKAIADYCHKMICKTPQDLLQVKGIGSKTLQKIEADLRFADD
ncbi:MULTISPECIES: helix-hairpin-helix domain-containing protein [Thiomicrorhabdus]|uniref:Helix-hairpin-helix domain-containing protein n=1 Tax=Thiomicrorhabdus heinhorstiae TaxID=2748010 RepID=A0ABS0BWR6_9GAMM|nr:MULTISPECIES: helix-hairpin-helix domain-containing protein [Thiomicrorhabdus]MBF6057261.1 helix-hairpin-helix domain-containing protein [Thiomicrorhabdus heinhorstiae]